MMVSTRGRYALRVLVDLAEHRGEGYITLKEIAGRQEISEKYLETIVKDLVKLHVLEGVRGKGGGYRLDKEPKEINVLEILRVMEGTLSPVACLAPDSKPCSRSADCRTLPLWQGLDQVVSDYLRKFTIQDLVRQSED